jgi:sortase A
MRRGMRASLRFVSHVAIVAGVLLVVDAGLTVIWQEPLSAYLASRAQADLRAQLEVAPRPPDSDKTGTSRRQALSRLARRLDRRVDPGEALGEILIPKIDVSFVIVQGTRGADLRKGPGHYERTSLPGERGTFAVAGHRTTYLAPFRDIDDLERKDRIVVRMPYGRFVYEVDHTRIVEPTETSVLDPGPHERIVLTACHPLYSAKQRIAAFARLKRAPS